MTVGELMTILGDFPEDDTVDWMLFSRLTPRRGDVYDNDVMIKRNDYNNHTSIMIDLPKSFETDMVNEYERMKKICEPH